MTRRTLRQYKGQLSSKKIAAGMNAARSNARRLVDDAKSLLEAKRYQSAGALAILSIEESGKVSILRELAVAQDGKGLKKCWRDYRSHTSKNAMWIFPQLVAQGGRELDHFRQVVSDDSDHTDLLDTLKQVFLYTDCVGNDGHWTIPEHLPAPGGVASLATSLVTIASVLCAGRDVSEKEVFLWIKHMKPVAKAEMGWMKTAVVNWYKEMVEEGLAEASEFNMEQFVRGADNDLGYGDAKSDNRGAT